MPHFICTTCGTQHAESQAPPDRCPICEDERQYLGWDGQRWTTLDQLRADYTNRIRTEEPSLTGIGTEPKFGIGQRALLVQSPGGNVLWDCIALIDEATIRVVNDLYDQLARGKSDLDFVAERVGHCEAQLERLAWRNERIRNALTMLYLALSAFAGTSLTLGVDVLTGHYIGALPTLLAVVGVGSMLGAAVSLLLEALAALQSYRLETSFYRDLHNRRRATRPS